MAPTNLETEEKGYAMNIIINVIFISPIIPVHLDSIQMSS